LNNDSFGRTPDEIEDEARHGYAVGTVALRAVADEISEIVRTRWEREHLHNELYCFYELLGTHTVFGMRDEPVTDGSPKALWAYWDTYSDGTPVTIVVGPPSSGGRSAPSNERSCGIPWLPNIMSTDGYDADGPIPPGCEVIVVAPPHERKSTARAACEQADSDSEALKTRLRETER
jgi:hypothetical protein